jgi:hypothetical protein
MEVSPAFQFLHVFDRSLGQPQPFSMRPFLRLILSEGDRNDDLFFHDSFA